MKRAEANRQKAIAILAKKKLENSEVLTDADLKVNHSRPDHVGVHRDYIWSPNKHATAIFYSKNNK